MVLDSELKVAVLGLGYIGLPTAAVIARTGAKVLGVDVHAHVVDTVNSGRVHIEEIDLDGLVSGVVARGNLRASLEIEPSDVFVIAVPTPFGEDHVPDIGYVLKAATTVAVVLKPGDVVILESTSPVGTTGQVAELLAKLRPDLKIPGHCTGVADVAQHELDRLVAAALPNGDPAVRANIVKRADGNARFLEEVRIRFLGDEARIARMSLIDENGGRYVRMAHLACAGSHAISRSMSSTLPVSDARYCFDQRSTWRAT